VFDFTISLLLTWTTRRGPLLLYSKGTRQGVLPRVASGSYIFGSTAWYPSHDDVWDFAC
jgi:hypothetical protein